MNGKDFCTFLLKASFCVYSSYYRFPAITKFASVYHTFKEHSYQVLCGSFLIIRLLKFGVSGRWRTGAFDSFIDVINPANQI